MIVSLINRIYFIIESMSSMNLGLGGLTRQKPSSGVLSCILQCSAQTSAKRTQQALIQKLIKKSRDTLGAPKGRKVSHKNIA